MSCFRSLNGQATRYRVRLKAVEAVKGLVSLMGKLHLDPQAGVIDVLERALLLVGKPRSDLCDARYGMLSSFYASVLVRRGLQILFLRH